MWWHGETFQLAQIFNGDAVDGSLVNVQQAYVSYLAPVGKGLTVDFGKFVTPVGFELTESNTNFNYSRSLGYALGAPYYHVGARLSYAPNDKVSLLGLVVNGWNAAGDNNAGKTVGASLTLKPNGKTTVVENVLFGPEQTNDTADKRLLENLNLAYNPTEKVSTGLDYYYAKDTVSKADVSYQAVALYLRGQVTKVFAVAPRFEYFDDKDGLASGTAQKLKELTLTGEFKSAEGVICKVEYRRDYSDTAVFSKNGAATKNQNTFSVSMVYAFSSNAK